MALSLLDGNETTALGAMEAGCQFFAGYPITPATTIFNTMLKLLPQKGGVCLQGEDEIASIGYCLGASMAGMKVMTATSGPGISLYSENISFAIGSEIPIVIIDVQRLAPSTGSATRGADGDIQFLRWGSSSGLPVIVLAPADAADCYLLTQHAFNLAEKFRCPVFIASNKEIGMTKESVDLDLLEKPAVINRALASASDDMFIPFKVKEGSDVPDFLPIGYSGKLVRQTSSTHGENGYITTDPVEIEQFQDRLKNKIESNVDSFTYFEESDTNNSDTLVISYGITSRSVTAALELLKKEEGKIVSSLTLKTLWPVPEKLIKEKAQRAKRIIVVEMNKGQYVNEIKRVLCGKKIEFIGQMNGALIEPEKIRKVITKG